MGTEEVGLNGEGRLLLEAADDTEHFQFVLRIQSIAALDFNGAGTEGSNLFQTVPCVSEKLVLGGGAEAVHRVEDSPSPFGNLLIAEAFNLVDVLDFAAAGIHDVGVRVTEGREDHPSGGSHHLDRFLDLFQHLFGKIGHLSKIVNLVAHHQQVSVFNARQVAHFLASSKRNWCSFCLHQFLDILD